MSRIRVLTFGDWDLLHVGHVQYLDEASKLGELVVAVSTDEWYERQKGHKPWMSQTERIVLVGAIKSVSGVIPYNGDYQRCVERVNATVVWLSHEHKGEARFNEVVVPIIWSYYDKINASSWIKERAKKEWFDK